MEHVGQLARLGDVARHQGEAELLDELLVRRVGVADDLAAELYQPTVVELHLLDPTAHPSPRLEDDDIGATGDQVAGGGQPGETGSDDDRVVGHARTS